MSYNNVPTLGLAIDWETTGYVLPNYTHDDKVAYQGISFGAIVFRFSDLETIEEIYHEIKFDPTRYAWSAGAEKVHGITREHLDQHGITQEEAAAELGTLCHKYFANTDIVLLGHRPLFDRHFTEQLMDTLGLELKLHPVMVDTAALGAALLGIWKSEELFTSLGFGARGKHNSLEDIRLTLNVARILREFTLQGLQASL